MGILNNMEQENVEQEIVAIVKGLISKMGFVSSIEMKKAEEDEDVIICNIKTEDSSFLIGQYGLNLQSLQHIARVIIRKKIIQPVNFILDVNSYRQEKKDSVVRLTITLRMQSARAYQEERYLNNACCPSPPSVFLIGVFTSNRKRFFIAGKERLLRRLN